MSLLKHKHNHKHKHTVMTAHCIDACNVQYSARAKRYTKFLVQQALAAHSAVSAEQRRRNEDAQYAAAIAQQRAIENQRCYKSLELTEEDFDD